MRAAIHDAAKVFLRWVDLPDSEGIIPDLVVIDSYHYMRMEDRTDLAYRLCVGRHTIETSSVPIYLAKFFERPILFESKQIRLFSGYHGATPLFYEQDVKLAWNTRSILQIRGITAVRFNGIHCPEIPREPGVTENGAFLHDLGTRAIRWMRNALKVKSGLSGPRNPIQFNALGVDEYGRLVCDVRIREKYGVEVTPITPKALDSGLFMPTRLVTE